MNDSCAVSVIIPVYNAAPFLSQAVFPLFLDPFEDWEILLVDDGSEDGSVRIAEKLCERDPRVRLIQKEHAGVSEARNAGLREARGTFITFVDADDVPVPGLLNDLFALAKESGADVACVSAFNGENPENSTASAPMLLDTEQALKSFFTGTLSIVCYGKLFRREQILPFGFAPDISLHEDKLFLFQALLASEKVVFRDLPRYRHVIRKGSLSREPFSSRDFDLVEAARRIETLTAQHAPGHSAEANAERLSAELHVLRNLLRTPGAPGSFDKEKQQLLRSLREPCPEEILRALYPRTKRLERILAGRTPALYAMLLHAADAIVRAAGKSPVGTRRGM